MGRRSNPFRVSSHTAALVLTAALAAGCAMGPSPAYVPSTAAAEDRGLEVRLPSPYALDQGPWALFHLNKPAYVAIFEVRPGLGVEALYPYGSSPAMQRRFPAGMNTVIRHRSPSSLRLASGVGAMPGRYACVQEAQSPIVYRMIVASERPLSLDRVQSYASFQMRPALRSRHFAFGSPLDTMEDLLHMVLPAGAAYRSDGGADPRGPDAVEWAADYVAYWLSDPNCVSLLAMAPFSPVHRFGSKLHPVTPGPPIGEPGQPEEPGEEPDDGDIVVVRPDAPTESPDGPAPPLRDREDGVPRDGPTRPGSTGARADDLPADWAPERRQLAESAERRQLTDTAERQRQLTDTAERQRLLPQPRDPGTFERLRVLEGRRAASARPDRVGARDFPGSVRDRMRGAPARPLLRPPPRSEVHGTPRASPRPSAERDGPRVRPPARAQPRARPQVRPSSPPPRSSSESRGSGRDTRDSRD